MTNIHDQNLDKFELERVGIEVLKLKGKSTETTAVNREELERYKVLIENIRDVIWTSDLYLNWTYMSPKVYDLVGWTPEELMAMKPEETIKAESLAQLYLMIQNGLKILFEDKTITRWPHDFEVEQFHKDGHTIWTEVLATILRDDEGTPVGYLGVTRNITARKELELELQRIKADLENRVEERTAALTIANRQLQAENKERRKLQNELERSKVFHESLLDQTIDYITIISDTGEILYITKAFQNVTGYSIAEGLGVSIFDLIHKDDHQSIAQSIKNAFENPNIAHKNSYRIFTKSGEIKIIESIGKLISEELGYGNALMVNSRDVTEREKLNKELNKMQKLESLGVLAGGIAHDFNNYLTALQGNISLVEMKTQDPEIIHYLSRMKTAGQMAHKLTDQLLTFARGGEPVMQVVDLKKLVTDCNSFVLSGDAIHSKLDFPNIDFYVKGDPGQLHQVFHNLLVNAKQAMNGSGLIKISMSQTSYYDEQYIKISVTDQGCGISENDLANIFDPFFSTKENNSGLGLATSHSIIKAHQGQIEVESQEDEGTTFSVLLPKTTEKPIKFATKKNLFDQFTGRILFMDDDTEIRNLMESILVSLGTETVIVKDGTEAVSAVNEALASNAQFDLIILDYIIRGGQGGLETLKQIREKDNNVPVVVTSGYSNNPVLARFAEYGFSGRLPKPFDSQEVIALLDDFLGNANDASPQK